MKNFTIQLNDQDELSYRGYWIDLKPRTLVTLVMS